MRKPSISGSLVVFGASLLMLAPPVVAALQVRGTDTQGNRLIFDTDLNITWYDFSNPPSSSSSWYTHLDWASGLAVTLNGVVYDDWRLSTMVLTEDPPVWAFTGTTSYGYNISSSEMGHLFHTELGNIGRYETSGVDRGPQNRLVNTGPFEHLLPVHYYNDVTSPLNVWSAGYFNFGEGEQYVAAKLALGGTGLYGIAVRQGDVIPEPASLVVMSAFVPLLALSRSTWLRHR